VDARRQRLDDPDRLQALQRSLLVDTPTEAVFDQTAELARTLLSAPVALVSLVDDTRQFFKACAGLPEPWASRRGTGLSHSFCQHVVEREEPLVVRDARTDPRVAGNLAIDDIGVVAYAGWPLHGPDGHVLGSLCVIDDEPRSWTAEEVEALRRMAGLVDEIVRLRQETLSTEVRHQARLEREVAMRRADVAEALAAEEEARAAVAESEAIDALSRRLQRGLLPKLDEPELAKGVHVAYEPGSGRLLLGGDFVDVVRAPDGAIDFAIGDVCGHGPEAAALAVAVRSSWAALEGTGVDLGELVERLNGVALREQAIDGLFVTMLVGRFHTGNGDLEVIAAGHPLPLGLGAEGPHELPVPFGLPLGLIRDASWETTRAWVDGHGLLLYTDGLVEGRTGDGPERLGDEGLSAMVRSVEGDDPAALVAALVERAEDLNGGPLLDDVAAFVVQRR
jgi:serine phosphatase RsbU (regulator of sigma subunit)